MIGGLLFIGAWKLERVGGEVHAGGENRVLTAAEFDGYPTVSSGKAALVIEVQLAGKCVTLINVNLYRSQIF